MNIKLVVVAILYSVSLLVQADESNSICPLTSELMMSRLVAIKINLEGNKLITKDEDNHLLRMAGEILKNPLFEDLQKEVKLNKQSCSYFFLSVFALGMNDEEVDIRELNRKRALDIVDRCISYIGKRFQSSNDALQSYYCK